MPDPTDNLTPDAFFGATDQDFHRGLTRMYAQQYNLDPDLFERQVEAESHFNPRAVSPKGAIGLGQIMPSTGARYGFKPQDLYDPHTNLHVAAAEMQRLNGKYNDPRRALGAYNAGEGNIDKGVWPRETRNYVQSILRPVGTQGPQQGGGLTPDQFFSGGEGQQGGELTPDKFFGGSGGTTPTPQQQMKVAPIADPETLKMKSLFEASKMAGDRAGTEKYGAALKQKGWEFGQDTQGNPYVKPGRKARFGPQLAQFGIPTQEQVTKLQFESAKAMGNQDEADRLGKQLQQQGWEYNADAQGNPYVKPPEDHPMAHELATFGVPSEQDIADWKQRQEEAQRQAVEDSASDNKRYLPGNLPGPEWLWRGGATLSSSMVHGIGAMLQGAGRGAELAKHIPVLGDLSVGDESKGSVLTQAGNYLTRRAQEIQPMGLEPGYVQKVVGGAGAALPYVAMPSARALGVLTALQSYGEGDSLGKSALKGLATGVVFGRLGAMNRATALAKDAEGAYRFSPTQLLKQRIITNTLGMAGVGAINRSIDKQSPIPSIEDLATDLTFGVGFSLHGSGRPSVETPSVRRVAGLLPPAPMGAARFAGGEGTRPTDISEPGPLHEVGLGGPQVPEGTRPPGIDDAAYQQAQQLLQGVKKPAGKKATPEQSSALQSIIDYHAERARTPEEFAQRLGQALGKVPTNVNRLYSEAVGRLQLPEESSRIAEPKAPGAFGEVRGVNAIPPNPGASRGAGFIVREPGQAPRYTPARADNLMRGPEGTATRVESGNPNVPPILSDATGGLFNRPATQEAPPSTPPSQSVPPTPEPPTLLGKMVKGGSDLPPTAKTPEEFNQTYGKSNLYDMTSGRKALGATTPTLMKERGLDLTAQADQLRHDAALQRLQSDPTIKQVEIVVGSTAVGKTTSSVPKPGEAPSDDTLIYEVHSLKEAEDIAQAAKQSGRKVVATGIAADPTVAYERRIKSYTSEGKGVPVEYGVKTTEGIQNFSRDIADWKARGLLDEHGIIDNTGKEAKAHPGESDPMKFLASDAFQNLRGRFQDIVNKNLKGEDRERLSIGAQGPTTRTVEGQGQGTSQSPREVNEIQRETTGRPEGKLNPRYITLVGPNGTHVVEDLQTPGKGYRGGTIVSTHENVGDAFATRNTLNTHLEDARGQEGGIVEQAGKVVEPVTKATPILPKSPIVKPEVTKPSPIDLASKGRKNVQPSVARPETEMETVPTERLQEIIDNPRRFMPGMVKSAQAEMVYRTGSAGKSSEKGAVRSDLLGSDQITKAFNYLKKRFGESRPDEIGATWVLPDGTIITGTRGLIHEDLAKGALKAAGVEVRRGLPEPVSAFAQRTGAVRVQAYSPGTMGIESYTRPTEDQLYSISRIHGARGRPMVSYDINNGDVYKYGVGQSISDYRRAIIEAHGPEPRGGGEQGSIASDLLVPKFIADRIPEIKKTFEGVRRFANPVLGERPGAWWTSRAIRDHAAQMAADDFKTTKALEDTRKWFSSNQEWQLPFMKAVETADRTPSGQVLLKDENGKPLPQKLQALGQLTRDILDQHRDMVQKLGTGALQNYYENYFPHIWQDVGKAQQFVSDWFSKRPLAGQRSFLKQRTFPTIQEGLDWTGSNGEKLKLASDNPVDSVLSKVHELNKYAMGQRLFQEQQAKGQLRFVPERDVAAAQQAGSGVINDNMYTIFGRPSQKGAIDTKGRWMTTRDAADVMNNYLSPGLAAKEVVGPLFRGYRTAGNILNMANFGLSFRHMMFVSVDAMSSRFALGIAEAASGRFGKSLSEFANTIKAPYDYISEGSKLMKEVLAPGSQGADYAALVDSVVAGGGRFAQDSFYATQFRQKFMDAWHQGAVGKMGLTSIPAGLEVTTDWMMKGAIPRMKLGLMADLARHELTKLGPDYTREQMRDVMSRAWDTVDDRMGQLVYDNIFWNKTLKDLAMASTRSVGWNLGTARVLGGGAVDAAKLLMGKDLPTQHRVTYALALPITAGILGASLQYLLTWHNTGTPMKPQGDDLSKRLWDVYHPRTGLLDENGNAERIDLPTYMKDAFEYFDDPLKTVRGKVNPVLNAIAEMLQNRDFYNTKIFEATPWGDPQRFAHDVGREAWHVAEPFSIQRLQREKATGGSALNQALPFIGLQRSPADFTKTPAQLELTKALANQRGAGAISQQEFAREDMKRTLVSQLRGKRIPADEVFKQMSGALDQGTISTHDIDDIMSRSINPRSLATQFLRVNDFNAALDVFSKADEKEKEELHPLLMQKAFNEMSKYPSAAKQAAIREQLSKAGITF